MSEYEVTEGSIAHVELITGDVDASRRFYEEVFSWEITVDEEMDYTMWRAPNAPSGAFFDASEWPSTPPSALFYVNVADLEATTAAITDAGGEVVMEETVVPEMGKFVVFRDPGGIIEAVWEDTYEGDSSEGEWPLFTDDPDDSSLVHFEFYTEDPEATRRFHEDVFGWSAERLEDDAYTMVYPQTPPYGGLMQATDEMPVGTLPYLLVGSATDACKAIEAAGGTILRDPFEVEGWGHMAVFEAPGGIVQAVWERVEDTGEAVEGGQRQTAT